MAQRISDKVRDWTQDPDTAPQIYLAHEQIEFLTDRLFVEYVPTLGSRHKSFFVRLADWLDSAPDPADQQVMFQLVSHLFFVARDDFMALYRAAFNESVCPWLLEQIPDALDDTGIAGQLGKALQHTWFCPITDSMQIADFYHVNNLSGVGLRPDWCALSEFGDPNKIVDYMRRHGLERIVLLEDFVGCGEQMKKAIDYCLALPPEYPTLIAPIIVCPDGGNVGRTYETGHPNLGFRPVVELPEHALVKPTPVTHEDELFPPVRSLVQRLETLIRGGTSGHWYGPFGFPRSDPTGALVVMYTNCPNNTLPIVHHNSTSWSPLFPRASRL